MTDLKKVADEIWYFRKIKSIMPIIITVIITILVVLFLVSLFTAKYGGLYIKSDEVIIIADNRYLKEAKNKLSCPSPKYIAACTDVSIPAYVDKIDGEHNGDDYLAYTFYCSNKLEDDIDCELQLKIIDTSIIGKLLHVDIYDNGTKYDYILNTYDENKLISHKSVININEVHKFTIVMWFEIDFTNNTLQTTDVLNANLQIVKLSD